MNMSHQFISDADFNLFKQMLFDVAGITLSDAKKTLLVNRLAKRLRHTGIDSYGAYYRYLKNGENQNEMQIAIELLTTNETYFFREEKHFHYLRDKIIPQQSATQPLRIWSAACSYGHEPYTIAMVIDDALKGKPWELVASDINTQVLAKAERGLYPLAQSEKIPTPLLKKYCLKGKDQHADSFLVSSELRSRIDFRYINLNTDLPEIGLFDVIFLRNVLIYFDRDTKAEVIKRITTKLKPSGFLMVGHSESLNGVNDTLQVMQPAVYRKP
jgi:chemotaxis protein methyltransferase CheR